SCCRRGASRSWACCTTWRPGRWSSWRAPRWACRGTPPPEVARWISGPSRALRSVVDRLAPGDEVEQEAAGGVVRALGDALLDRSQQAEHHRPRRVERGLGTTAGQEQPMGVGAGPREDRDVLRSPGQLLLERDLHGGLFVGGCELNAAIVGVSPDLVQARGAQQARQQAADRPIALAKLLLAALAH